MFEALRLVGGHVDQAGAQGVGHVSHDHQVSQPLQQVLGKPSRVLADLDHLVDGAEDALTVAGGQRVDHLVEQGIGGVAEQRGGLLVTDAVGAGRAEQLVEHRQRVTHRSGAGTHHERQDAGLNLHVFLDADLLEVVGEHLRGHQPEGIVVGARADGADHLVGLGGGEDELHVRRRLLHHLQQRVEALLGDHVGLVDDVDLEARLHRCEEDALAQLAGVVDAAMGGGVDLDHVDAAGPPGRQFAAARAMAAGSGRGAVLTVEAARKDAGTGGFSAAARAAEQVGVAHPVVGDRTLQRQGHMVLADHLLEGVGTIAPVERQGRPRVVVGRRRIGRGSHRGIRRRDLTGRQGLVAWCVHAAGIGAVRHGSLRAVRAAGFGAGGIVEQGRTVLLEEIVLRCLAAPGIQIAIHDPKSISRH